MKLMKVLLAVLVMAAMVTPAIAEDRLTLSGSLQVRGQIYDVDQESAYSEYTGSDAERLAYELELRNAVIDEATKIYVLNAPDGYDFDALPITNIGDAIQFIEDNDNEDGDGMAAVEAYANAFLDGFSREGQVKTKKLNDTYAWNDMRMRIGGKIAVAEGISVNFRFDTSESAENSSDPLAWGADNQYSARRADIQFDKAYLEIVKNGFTLQAGELYFGGFSPTQSIMDFTAPGFIVKYGDFTIAHAKRFDENVGNDTFGIGHTGDSNQTAAKYVLKGEGFTLVPAIGYNYDDSNADNDLLGISLSGSVDLGAAMLKGEVVYFDGQTDSAKFGGRTAGKGTDLKGLNIMLDGSMDASDMIRVGLRGFYAPEQDGKGDVQVYNMSDDSVTDWAFVDYNPQHYGAYDSDFVYTDKWDIWDPSGKSAGVIAGQLYADVKASADLGLKFAGMYFESADDNARMGADVTGYSLDAGLSYAVAKNTSLDSHLNYMVLDNDDYDTTDKFLGIITGLTVKF